MRKLIFLITIAIILLFVSCDINLDEDIEVSYNITSSGQLSLADSSATLPEFLEIPSSVDGVEVKSLSSDMFSNRTELKYVVLPVGITEIPDNAFSGCSELLGIYAPGGLTKIGEYAFYNCSSFGGIDTNSVTYIDYYAFSGCSSLKTINLSSVERIYDNAFRNCTSLTSISLPKTLITMQSNAFRNCTCPLIFEEGRTSIACDQPIDGVYYRIDLSNSKFSSISIPASVEGNISGLYGCSSPIILTGNRTSIGCLFRENSSITSITIPETVTSLCSKEFEGCTGLKTVTIPASVTSIGYDAFSDCYCDVIFASGTQTIPDEAFECAAGISSVSIPSTVTTIGALAFQSCGDLDIYYQGTEDQWDNIEKGSNWDRYSELDIKYEQYPKPVSN